MRLKEILKFMFYLFCIITTSQLFFVTMLMIIRNTTDEISINHFYSILISSFVGVLPTIMFVFTENISRKGWFISRFIHFILTASFVYAALIYFEQLQPGIPIPTIIFFFIIYFSAHLYQEIQAKKIADELNKRISATHKD